MAISNSSAAQEPPAANFITAIADMQCDQANRSWKVVNEHTYRSIQVTVRWQAVGTSKALTEQLVLPPQTSRQLGCAPRVEIVAAEEMQF